MRVMRTGRTPLKGGRHAAYPAVDLAAAGPAGDRVFCLVDPARRRVLRTVENRDLLRLVARWSDGELTLQLPTRTVTGVPQPTGRRLEVDYWGRAATVEPMSGPWAEAVSEHLGYAVALARPVAPGDVVYGGSVSLVTTASLDWLVERLGEPVDSARFRATFTVDSEDLPAFAEEDWSGSVLRIGAAEVRVRGPVPRCAVVDLDPATGQDTAEVLRALARPTDGPAGYRRATGEVTFGIDAVVTRPGRVRVGDPVEVLAASEPAPPQRPELLDVVGGR